MSVFVGLDCGGSSSRVLAVDNAGNTLFQGHSGAANLVSTPEGRLRKNLVHATNGCPPATFVCGCFAGLINDDARSRGELHLKALFPDAEVRAEPDYTAALYASPKDTDVCVIAGTGSLVCSRGPSGIVKSGGRGYLLGDYGSAFHYGRDALIHYLDHPKTSSPALKETVIDVFGSERESDIVAAVHRSLTPATILARFARALGSDAKSGEEYAIRSLDRHTAALADVVALHVRRNLSPTPVLHLSLAGGLWKGASVFRDVFVEQLKSRFGDTALVVNKIVRPPMYGAVELAREMSFGN